MVVRQAHLVPATWSAVDVTGGDEAVRHRQPAPGFDESRS